MALAIDGPARAEPQIGALAASGSQKVFLVRHAQASGQDLEAPLTEQGVASLASLVRFFRAHRVEQVHSSPAARSIQTALAIARSKNLPVLTDRRLIERRLAREARSDWQDQLRLSFADPNYSLAGGESLVGARHRIFAVLQDIARSRSKAVAIVSHGNLIAACLGAIDCAFGYDGWRAMGNPHVYAVEIGGAAPAAFVDYGIVRV